MLFLVIYLGIVEVYKNIQTSHYRHTMPGKTTYLTISDFTERGVIDSSGLEYNLNNFSFRKGDSLGHHQIKEILDTCKKYHNIDINTLIVKDEKNLTLWIEEKSKRVASQPVESSNDEEESAVETPANNQLPTKTVTKRYRGQVYEETVVDWAAVQQLNQQEKPRQEKSRRKYRGRYID